MALVWCWGRFSERRLGVLGWFGERSGSWGRGDEVFAEGVLGGFVAAAELELGEDVAHVALGGVEADAEPSGDLAPQLTVRLRGDAAAGTLPGIEGARLPVELVGPAECRFEGRFPDPGV